MSWQHGKMTRHILVSNIHAECLAGTFLFSSSPCLFCDLSTLTSTFHSSIYDHARPRSIYDSFHYVLTCNFCTLPIVSTFLTISVTSVSLHKFSSPSTLDDLSARHEGIMPRFSFGGGYVIFSLQLSLYVHVQSFKSSRGGGFFRGFGGFGGAFNKFKSFHSPSSSNALSLSSHHDGHHR